MAGVNPRGNASASAPDVADKLRQQKKEYQLQKKAATAKPTMSFGQNRQLAQIIDEPSPAFDKVHARLSSTCSCMLRLSFAMYVQVCVRACVLEGA